MAYWLLDNDRAQYAIDWDVVLRIVRAFHRAHTRWDVMKVRTTSDSDWYNPMSWALPEVKSLEVDWELVRPAVNRYGDADFETLAEIATRDVPEMVRQLRYMVSETARMTNLFLDEQSSIQSENTARMVGAIEKYDGAIEVAKFVRDTSADGLMVGASIMTGGAGVALLAGGATMKGYGKFQDTNNIGAGVLYGVGSFVFGAFKLGGRTLQFKEEAVVAVLQAQWETGVALAEGKSLGDALATGSLKLAGPLVDSFFKLPRMQRVINFASIPVKITQELSAFGFNFANIMPGAATTQPFKAITATVVTKALSKVTQKQVVERQGKNFIHSLHTAGSLPRYSSMKASFMESVTPTDDMLLTLAVVNMAKGIGRGL